MQQLGRVQKRNDDGTALVLHIEQCDCFGACNTCSGCVTQQKRMFVAKNPINANLGQVVTVRANSGPVLMAMLAYAMPFILFFLGYYLCALLWSAGAAGGIASFVVGVIGAAFYDRKIAKKQTVYTITGFGHDLPEFLKKGDNYLDQKYDRLRPGR